MINISFNFPIRLWENWHIYLKNYKFLLEFYFFYTKNILEVVKFLSCTLNLEVKNLKRFSISNTQIKSCSKYTKRKLYQQKGLGKARVGSKKSPLQKKGVRTFGSQLKKTPAVIKNDNFLLILKYLMLNKRTNVYIINICTCIKYLDKINKCLQLQLQLNGILSQKVLFISLNKHHVLYFKFKHKFNRFSFFNINKLNCYKLLFYKYIFMFI